MSGIDLLQLTSEELRTRMREFKTDCYTERDGGDWYIVTPDHHDRIGQDFADRDDARRLICVLAGDPMPAGWSLVPNGGGDLSYSLRVGYEATIWTRDALALIRRMRFETAALFGEPS